MGLPLSPAVRHAAVAVIVLHTAVALWVWRTWGELGRSNLLVYMDFPVSLAFLHLSDRGLLTGSLLLGGLQWATVAGLLTWLVGRSARSG